MNAVDTNVLVYSLDVDEPAKQAKAKALLAGFVEARPTTIVPWQVAGELLPARGNQPAAYAARLAEGITAF